MTGPETAELEAVDAALAGRPDLEAVADRDHVQVHHRAQPARAAGLLSGDIIVAVDGIDFEIAPGEAFGFLGPNGAGKTSSMRMIGCVSPITDGYLRVLGLDPAGSQKVGVQYRLQRGAGVNAFGIGP